MLVGTILKERTDHSRVTIDFTRWLDTGETIKEIVASDIVLGMSGWSNTAYPDPWYPAPDDPTPLAFETITFINGDTAIQMLLDDGTPGNSYTVTFVVHGMTSNRELTVEVGVQIAGNPPAPVDVPALPALPTGELSSAIGYFEIGVSPIEGVAYYFSGGTLTGPLYLFEDPQTTMEAVTRRYVDAWVVAIDREIADELARATAVEDALNELIVTETTARIAGQLEFATNLASAEAVINAATAAVIVALNTEIAIRSAVDVAETAERVAKDLEISTNLFNAETTINATMTAVIGALNAEIGQRAADDTAIETTITARLDGDLVSQTFQAVGNLTTPTALSGWAMGAAGDNPFVSSSITYAVSCGASNMLAQNYYAISDVRFKLDIEEITEEDALQWLARSRPVSYLKLPRYGADPATAVREAGFVAQEQVVAGYGRYVGLAPCPGLPERADPEITSQAGVQLSLPVNYQVALLTRAVQALAAQLEELRSRPLL